MLIKDTILLLPEISISIMVLTCLIMGFFLERKYIKYLMALPFIASSVFMIYMVMSIEVSENLFGNHARVSLPIYYAKIIISLVSLSIIFLTNGTNQYNKRFELPILVALATLGMMILVSSNSLLLFYLGFELMSLSLYILVAMDRDSLISTEAGLKYFILSSVASSIMLFGITLIYGVSGSIFFEQIYVANLVQEQQFINLVGLIFILSGIFFKLSAVPFHMWTPDVYQGSPTITTLMLATNSKIAITFVFLTLAFGVFAGLSEQWSQVVSFVAGLSMIVGAVGALVQTNLKRILAYSSISHVGFILLGFAVSNVWGVEAVLTYIVIYAFMTLGLFAVLLIPNADGRLKTELKDIAGLSKTNPYMALLTSILIFSMAAVPPMAGFFAKFYILLVAVQAELYSLTFIGIISSLIAAYYYLMIIKSMYFDEPTKQSSQHVNNAQPIQQSLYTSNVAVSSICAVANLGYIFYPVLLLSISSLVARYVVG